MFGIYNASLFIFGIGDFMGRSVDNNKKIRGWHVLTDRFWVSSRNSVFLPSDHRGTLATIQGTVYIIIVEIISLFIILSIFITGISLKK